MIEIFFTDEFGEWFEELIDKDQDSVAFVVGLLENTGLRFKKSTFKFSERM